MKKSALPGALTLLVGCAFAGSALADEPPDEAVPVAAAVPVATAVPAAAVERSVKPARPVPRTAPAVAKTMVKPLVLTVLLSNGTTISGNLLETTGLNMKTSFGDAVFPWSEVAGVKMASEANPVTTVVLLNGDSITGAADVSRIEIQTEWGKVEINGPNISSLLFAQGLKWVSAAGLNGSRWTLAAESPLVAAGKQPPATAKANPLAQGAPMGPGPPPPPVTRATVFGR